MTVNLRLSLTIFKIGFAAEAVGGLVALEAGTSALPFHGLLLYLTPVFSFLGIVFLWIGRHEWNELHRLRVHHANLAFGVTLIAIGLAALPVALLVATGGAAPAGLKLEFGVAVALIFALTFITYALVAANLVGPVGRVAIGIGLGWAALVSGAIGLVLVPQLDPLVRTVLARSTNLAPITHPILVPDALLAFSYLAFFVAFVDAHYRVVKGIGRTGASPPTIVGTGPGSG